MANKVLLALATIQIVVCIISILSGDYTSAIIAGSGAAVAGAIIG
jgi:hypothetical protein